MFDKNLHVLGVPKLPCLQRVNIPAWENKSQVWETWANNPTRSWNVLAKRWSFASEQCLLEASDYSQSIDNMISIFS